MSWQNPDAYAKDLLDSVHPDVRELAKVLSLCPRIEPLLLRNMRLKFLPGSKAELEYRLWFSNIVTARSTRAIVLDQDAARLLADELKSDTDLFDAVWQYTQTYTAHWSALDKLEQQIRTAALNGDQTAINAGLQKILRQIAKAADEDARLNLARWAKKTLPVIGKEAPSAETAWLAQYAAAALGATAAWTELSAHEPLPNWLAKALPEPSPAFTTAKIGLQLYYDADSNRQVLECVVAEGAATVLDLPTPLPAKLYVQSENAASGRSYVVAVGSRIKIPQPAQAIELRTIDGQRYRLSATAFKPPSFDPAPKTVKLYLAHVREDAEIAAKLAAELERQQIVVILIPEIPGETAPETVADPHAKLLRLWTPIAQAQWAKTEIPPISLASNSLLLRAQGAELPLGTLAAQVLDLDETPNPAAAIQRWIDTPAPPIPPITEKDEITALLNELENPETKPRRRLEIGDRLADLGDPRPGVGIKKYEIIAYPPEIQRLLDELSDLNTEPPRRLKIGDRLAELGDPRPGVGLDARGLPDIDWVDIPAGPFLYGESKTQRTLELERFYIGRYPVTNRQYQAFVDAGGYTDDRWWQGLQKPAPAEPQWPHPNRPRETVDWYEAVAFTRWLSAHLGYVVSLPTEQQWEKAARGIDGRVYPWGNEYRSGYANIDETYQKIGLYYLRQTSAAGVYPQGSSPYGVMDMAGNVWEWCLNSYEAPEQVEPASSDGTDMLRGGSWGDGPDFAHYAARYSNSPNNRYNDIGFRVVCSSPSAGH